MKRTIVALLILITVTLPAFASEAFLLNIPLRFNTQQETGEVRVNMGLNAPPAGAQLVVGSTTLNLGDTATVAGDSVSFTAGTGNEARITYRPLSNFGADFCTAVNAVEKNIAMRFVGAQDILDYRVATYVVAAPNAECSAASKHTGDSPASLTPNDDGVAPALTADYKGRFTYDVAIVLDKSGSMTELPPGANTGANKATILRSAAKAFVANWEQLDQPVGPAEWSQDRLSLVFFDATAVSQTLPGADPPANVFVQRGASTAWDALITAIDTLTPGSSTSIGAGINEAMKQWKADPKNDLSLVVVTDGKQNTAPLITPTGTGFLGLDPVSGLPQELRQRFIPIQTIGFGMPLAVDEDLLRNIAFETSGVSYIDLNAFTVFNDFAITLIALLKGNTAAIARRQTATLTGDGPSNPIQVDVDRSPKRVVFSLQWAPPANGMLDLDVFPPGASAPASPSTSKTLPQAAIRTFNLRPSDAGTWSVRVKRGRKTDRAVPYTLNVFFLEAELDFQLSLDNVRAATGDRIGIRATVDWKGKRLPGLPPGSIKARVFRPTQALGTALHDTDISIDRIPTSQSGDPFSPADRKVAAMKPIVRKEVATIVLNETSKGVYAGTFDQTNIPGGYAFDVILDWKDERVGRVHREERIDQFVNLRADRTNTAITTTKGKDGSFTVTVTPRDRFGNFFGPGYASLIAAKVRANGKLASRTPSDRKQTGTYAFRVVDVPAGKTPVLDITVDGVNLTK